VILLHTGIVKYQQQPPWHFDNIWITFQTLTKEGNQLNKQKFY